MIKKLPGICLIALTCFSGSLSAQQPDIRITYDATRGETGLTGASRVYMHYKAVISGSNETWDRVTANGQKDDEAGIMSPAGNNIWSICLDPAMYIPPAPAGSASGDQAVTSIQLYFRNEDGTAFGYHHNGGPIVIDLTTDPPSSNFPGVTVSNCMSRTAETPMKDFIMYNFPNPVKTHTVITYQLKSPAAHVVIKIYDLIGQNVRTFKEYEQKSGVHKLNWSGENDKGSQLKNGLYFYALEVDGVTLQSNRLVLSR